MVPGTVRKGVLFGTLLLCSAALYAQRFENVKATFQNGTAIITYDLLGGSPGQKFNVEIYGSHNSYATPLKAVTGDVGTNVNGGAQRQVQWNAAAELGSYNGDIVFRLKGSLAVAPFSIISPTASVRRGKNTSVKWKGGSSNQQVKLDVVQNGGVVQSITTGTSNTGEFTWHVPSDLAKGTYNIKLTSGNDTAQSNTIQVKSKLPLLLIAAPVVVVGVLIAVLVKPDPDKGGGVIPDEDLPDAPGPK